MTPQRTVLFVHFGDNQIRGSERVLLDLLGGLDPQRVRPVLWCNGEAMAQEARAIGVTTYRSPMAYFLDYSSPRFSIRQYMSLMAEGRRLMREERVDVVHANGAAPCQWLAPAARSRLLPLVVHLHASYLPRSRYVCLLHMAHRVVGVSDYTLVGLREDGLSGTRTQVILNGVDARRFSTNVGAFRGELGISPDSFVILSVGVLIRRKRHHILIDAFARFHQETDAHLVIIGEGEARVELERQIAELGLAGRVHLLGARPALAGTYGDANCFALASYDESFGLVFAEAGLCGLPCLGMRGGGIPEVIEDGVTGILVDNTGSSGTSEAFSQGFSALQRDAGLCQALGAAARARITREFDGRQMLAHFHTLYDELAMSPPRARGWAQLGLAPYLSMTRRFGLARRA